MLTEPTLDRLRALRLGAMADAYRTQLQDPAIGALSFDERVGMLVDAEHLSRDNRKLTRRLKEAKLRIPTACLEDLEYAPRRELDRALMRQLATGRWIAEHRNVLITGATGVGKTYVACALGQPTHQEVMIHSVEKLFEVEVHDPSVTARQVFLRSRYRLMRRPPRPKAVAVVGKRRVEDGLKHLQHRLLDKSVENGGHA